LFQDALRLLKSETNRPLVENLMSLVLVEILANERGIGVSDRDLQEASDLFRRLHGLEDANATYSLIARSGLSVEDFELLLEAEVRCAKLKQVVSTVDAVQEVFSKNIALFETVELAGAFFETLEDAEAFSGRLAAGAAESDENTTHAPMPATRPPETFIYIGVVSRADIDEGAAARVFRDAAEAIVGPVMNKGKYWIYRILSPKRAVLNEEVYAVCEDLVLQQMLNEKRAQVLPMSGRPYPW
jgi:hypothetical protein